VSPLIEDGEKARETVWMALTPDEVRELRDALDDWLARKSDEPEWHFHLVDKFGRVLTVDVMEPDDARFAGRSSRRA
jgi:hypothetical protein